MPIVKCPRCNTDVECPDGLVPMTCDRVLSPFLKVGQTTRGVGYAHGLGRPAPAAPYFVPCKFCRRRLRIDDASKSIAHEAPQCDGFAALVASSGEHVTETIVVDAAGNVVPPAEPN